MCHILHIYCVPLVIDSFGFLLPLYLMAYFLNIPNLLYSPAKPSLDPVAASLISAQVVLDRTREQNVGIVLSYLKMPVKDLKTSLLEMDDTKLSFDSLSGLQSILPTAEEMKVWDFWIAFPSG